MGEVPRDRLPQLKSKAVSVAPHPLGHVLAELRGSGLVLGGRAAVLHRQDPQSQARTHRLLEPQLGGSS